MVAAFSPLNFLLPTGRGRALALAGGVLGAVALAQLLALTWFLASGGAAARRTGALVATTAESALPLPAATNADAQPAAATMPSGAGLDLTRRESLAPTGPSLPAPAPVPLLPGSTAFNPPGTDGTGGSSSGSLDGPSVAASFGGSNGSLAQPTPAPRYQPNPTDLVEQAKHLRASGDTQTALAKLREAQGITADNPLVIAEMALTYEAMQLPDRAALQWQRLSDLGESIGAPYHLAQMKLRQSNAGGGTEAGLMMAATTATSAANGGSGGLAENPGTGYAANAILRIVEAKQAEIADPGADKKVALRTVIKNKPGTAIDPRRVKVYAEFYDLVDGKDIAQTDADTGFQWLTSPVDWADDASEILETTYVRHKGTSGGGAGPNSSTPLLPPPPAVTASNGGKGKRGAGSKSPAPAGLNSSPFPGPVRSYVGFVVRLYYDRQLQDCKAEPERLLQQFSPVPTLPAE